MKLCQHCPCSKTQGLSPWAILVRYHLSGPRTWCVGTELGCSKDTSKIRFNRFVGNPCSGTVCEQHYEMSRYEDPLWRSKPPCSICAVTREKNLWSKSSGKRWVGGWRPEDSACPDHRAALLNTKFRGCRNCGNSDSLCHFKGEARRCWRCYLHTRRQRREGFPEADLVEYPGFPVGWTKRSVLPVIDEAQKQGCKNKACLRPEPPVGGGVELYGAGEARRCPGCRDHIRGQMNLGYKEEGECKESTG